VHYRRAVAYRIVVLGAQSALRPVQLSRITYNFISYRDSFGLKFEARIPLEILRRRWEYNIKMEVNEVGCGGVDYVHSTRNRIQWRAVVITLMNLRFP